MSKYLEQIQKYVYSNLGELGYSNEEVTARNVQNTLRDLLDEGNFCAPEFVYTYENWDIINDRDLDDPNETVDFSDCDNAIACVEREAAAVVEATYYRLLDEALGEITSALEEVEGEMKFSVIRITLGDGGLGVMPHDEEWDVGEGNLYWWKAYGRAQLDINGLSFNIKLEDEDDDA